MGRFSRMSTQQNNNPPFKGKTIGGYMYAHKSALPLISKEQKHLLKQCEFLIPNFKFWNVVKFNLKDNNKLSFLRYESFEELEFPTLIESCQVDLMLKTAKIRNHSATNPPVLHRKELLMHPDHPELEKFQSLTTELQRLGAFKNIVKLGTKLRWQDELDRLNIVIKDHVTNKTGEQNNVS